MLEDAPERPSTERNGFLESARGSDTELRSQVDFLIAL